MKFILSILFLLPISVVAQLKVNDYTTAHPLQASDLFYIGNYVSESVYTNGKATAAQLKYYITNGLTLGGSSATIATDSIWDAKGDLAAGTGANTSIRLAVGSNGQFLKANSATSSGLEWATIAGGGDLLAANNLSDVASAATSRSNLGLAIGSNVQAYDANLGDLAGGALTGVSSIDSTSETTLESALDLADLQGAVTDSQVPNTITVDLATLASTVTVIDGSDATSFPLIADSATGSLAVKTDAALTYDASTGILGATGFASSGTDAGSIDLGDSDGSHFFSIRPNGTTTTSVNMQGPAAPFSGYGQWTVSGTTNWIPSQVAFGVGLLGSDGSNVPVDVDTEAELETAIGSVDVVTVTSDDITSANLRTAVSDESGTGALIFAGGDVGAATANTPAGGDNDTSVATTAYVQTEIAGLGNIDDTAFASSWNGVTTDAPTKNAVYDWGHLFDTDDDGLVNALDATFTFSGMSVTGDGDGAITFLGTGDGADEDLTLNLDDTANNAIITTSTGLTNITLTAINLTVPTAVYDATAWNGNNTAPTRDDVRDKIEAYASDTVTFTGKTIDAAATGNVLKQIKSLKFNFPRLIDGTGCTFQNTNDYTAATFMVPQFSGTAATNASYARFAVRVPNDVDTSVDMTASLTIELTATDTAAHTYHVGMVSIANSAAIAGTAANYVVLTVAADASGASGDVESVTGTTLTGWAAAVTAGQWWLIELRRDGANDASTVASRFQELEIFYTSTQ